MTDVETKIAPARLPHETLRQFLTEENSKHEAQTSRLYSGTQIRSPPRFARSSLGGREEFRQPARLSLRRPRRKAADADDHRQQSRLARGAAGDPRRLSGRPCRQGQHHAAGRPQSGAGLREGRGVLWRIGEKVTTPNQLMPALRQAFDALRSGTP